MSEPTGNEPMCSVFCAGRYAGAVLHRGRMGYEAVDGTGGTVGLYASQKNAAAALVEAQQAVRP
jgi:hypothetical protein